MRQHRPKLRPLSIVAILCVALLMMANMILIFSFSAENREESGDRSRAVTTAIARLLDPSFDDMTDEEQTVAVERIHGVVRKAAHFLEFALLGFLSAGSKKGDEQNKGQHNGHLFCNHTNSSFA